MSDTRGPRPDLAKALEESDPGLALFRTRAKGKADAQRSFKPVKRMDQIQKLAKVSEDDIRLRAYLIWERTGKGADECWNQAKAELER